MLSVAAPRFPRTIRYQSFLFLLFFFFFFFFFFVLFCFFFPFPSPLPRRTNSLLKLTTLEDVCRFVRDELASRGARTALLSAVLGELEEVQRQSNTLPLTTFFHTHAAFESFVSRELAPALANCKGRAAQLRFVARRAWCDRTLIAGRKRKFMYMSGHIWHFVNSDMCNEFCFVLVALCAVRSLGIRNVYAVLSESHCWLGYVPDGADAPANSGAASGDSADAMPPAVAAAVKSEYDDDNVPPLTALEFLDILPPDRSREYIISPIADSRVGWAYQRDASGVQRAVVLTPQQLVAAMLVHVELTPDVKLPLLCSVPDDIALSLPNFVLAQAMCYHACGDVVHAALLYDCAVDVARQRFGDALVYPLMQRAEFRVSIGHFGEALTDFADMARIIRSYKLLETDAEMLDEATVAAAHVCDNVIPALVAQFSDNIAVLRAHFAHALQFYDHLLAWIEAAEVDPGPAWHTAVSLAIARHFPAAVRVEFGKHLLEQSGADGERAALVERLYASRVVRLLAARLVEMAAGERDDDILVRDVVEIFRRCAQHPLPPTALVAEPPVDQLADVFAEAVNEPWRVAAEDARIRQALAEAANGYNQQAGLVLPWPAADSTAGADAASVRRRSDPTGERLLHKSSSSPSIKRVRTDASARARKRPTVKPAKVTKAASAAGGVSAPAAAAAAMATTKKKSAQQRRKAAVVAAVLVTNDDASSGDELVEWTQCERCDRWVVLPPDVSPASLPAQWFCEMNNWSHEPEMRVCPKLAPRRNHKAPAMANGDDDDDSDSISESSSSNNNNSSSNGNNANGTANGHHHPVYRNDDEEEEDDGDDGDDDNDDDHVE
jgi:hypothetical protein